MIDYSKYRDPALYPDGISDFLKLRERKCIYVDKTALVYEMTRKSFVFLSRPRRFGKSLLCSTLKYYFEGRSDIFKGLAIMDLEKEWKKHPVFHFSISSIKDKPIEMMADALMMQLKDYEVLYGADPDEKTPGAKLQGLIKRARALKGERAVVIIDEYDSPILKYMHDEENLPKVRQIMQEFYQTLKECDADARFVFITGITKFSQIDLNLTDISMTDRFSSICGITNKELHSVFNDDVEMLAKQNNLSREQMYAKLKDMYYGYNFSDKSETVYNPYSIIRAFLQREVRHFYQVCDTPKHLICELLNRKSIDIQKYDGVYAHKEEFDHHVENMNDAKPLLYQSGYLTIKDYNNITNIYVLGIPNTEVRTVLNNFSFLSSME